MGQSFSTVYIHKNIPLSKVDICDSLADAMKKEGFHIVDSETLAMVTLKIVMDTDKWVTVYTDPQLFTGTDESGSFALSLSAALHTEVFVFACYDSDRVLLHLLNADRHTNNAVWIGDENETASTQNDDFSAWKPFVADVDTLQKIAAQGFQTEDTTLFDLQQLFGFSDNRDDVEDDADTVCLYFQQDAAAEQASAEKNASVSIRRQLSKYLKSLGFSKTKKYYTKKIKGELYLSVENYREAHATYYTRPHRMQFSNLPLYDLRIAITRLSCIEDDTFLNEKLSTLSRTPDKYRIPGVVNSSQQITEAIIDDFEKYVYAPLFRQTNAFFGLVDYMCFLDCRTRGRLFIGYYDKALAAFYERRYYEAMLFIKSLFLSNIVPPRTEITRSMIDNLSVFDIEALRYAEGDKEELLFSLYDEVRKAQMMYGEGLTLQV